MLTNSSSFSHSDFLVKLRTFLALTSLKYKRHRYVLQEGEEESNNGLIIRGGAQSRVAYSLFSRPSWNTRQPVKVLVESP